jgi:hypothetical protein
MTHEWAIAPLPQLRTHGEGPTFRGLTCTSPRSRLGVHKRRRRCPGYKKLSRCVGRWPISVPPYFRCKIGDQRQGDQMSLWRNRQKNVSQHIFGRNLDITFFSGISTPEMWAFSVVLKNVSNVNNRTTTGENYPNLVTLITRQSIFRYTRSAKTDLNEKAFFHMSEKVRKVWESLKKSEKVRKSPKKSAKVRKSPKKSEKVRKSPESPKKSEKVRKVQKVRKSPN